MAFAKKTKLVIGTASAVLLLDLAILAGDGQQNWLLYPRTVDHALVAWGSTATDVATLSNIGPGAPMPYTFIARGPS